MEPFVDRKPDKERLRAMLRHENPDRVPYWESIIHSRHLRDVLEREDVPAGSWLLSTEDQMRLVRITGQDAIMSPGVAALPRIRGKDGEIHFARSRELGRRDAIRRLVPYTEDDIRAQVELVLERMKKVEGTGIGVWTSCAGALWQYACEMIGFEVFMSWLLLEPELIDFLLDYMTEPVARAMEMLCEYPLTLLVFADNVSTPQGAWFDESDFRRLWRWRVEKIIAPARERGIPTMFHSTGRLDWLLDDIVAMGFDALNLVDLANNDIFSIKRQYGHRLCLVGGIDQEIDLAEGTEEHVDRVVRDRIERLGGGGGYVVSTSHFLGGRVKPENWRAMVRAVEKYGTRA